MKAATPLTLLLAVAMACRPSDGGSQNPPAPPAATTPADAQNARENEILARADAARIKGDTAAPVWIVEISDFQCPFCRRFWEETYPAIEREFVQTGVVRLAYVNLPLQMHANALPAAEAAMCAAEQDRFWPMHDGLFATQPQWAELENPAAVFDSLARAVRVDEPRYQECLRSNVMRRLINADMGRASSRGVRGTPHFFVGSERINGAAPIAEFRAAVARALAARQAPPSGASKTP